MCSGYKDFDLCKRWITEDTVSPQTFMARLEKYKKDHPELAKTNVFGVEVPTTSTQNIQSANDKTSSTSNISNEENKNEKTNNNSDKFNLVYIGIGTIILVLIGVVIVILLKKRGSK